MLKLIAIEELDVSTETKPAMIEIIVSGERLEANHVKCEKTGDVSICVNEEELEGLCGEKVRIVINDGLDSEYSGLFDMNGHFEPEVRH